MITKQVHIDTITQGATVIHNGQMKTVSGNNIKKTPVDECTGLFGSTSIFGDSYNGSSKLVTLVDFTQDLASNP